MNPEIAAGADAELIGDAVEVLALQTEMGALRRRLGQREQALADLNRRLLVLERRSGADDGSGHRINELESELAVLRQETERYRAEVDRLYATKLFRVAAPARRAYGRLRRR